MKRKSSKEYEISDIREKADPKTYQRWDQVPRSKHPLANGHSRREPNLDRLNGIICSQNQCVNNGLNLYGTRQTAIGPMTVFK